MPNGLIIVGSSTDQYVPASPAGLGKSRAAGISCFATLGLLHDSVACADEVAS